MRTAHPGVLVTYGHVMPDQADTTRSAIDQAWATAEGQAVRALR